MDFSDLGAGWEIIDVGKKLARDFEFKDFRESVIFINSIADIAEDEDHHPNLLLHDYNKVRVELWTHKVGGLTEKDFILAAKIEKVI